MTYAYIDSLDTHDLAMLTHRLMPIRPWPEHWSDLLPIPDLDRMFILCLLNRSYLYGFASKN